jgi:hypothetical protein
VFVNVAAASTAVPAAVPAVAVAPTDQTALVEPGLYELFCGISLVSEYFRGVKYAILGLPPVSGSVRAASAGPGFSVRDERSLIPYQLVIFLDLLAGCLSEKAKLRPAIVQLLGLLTCLFASLAYANANTSAVDTDKWFSVYSWVFVWMLPSVFFIPASPFRTFVVIVFDYGGAIFIFMIWKHLPPADPTTGASNVSFERGILTCGVLYIIHLLFLGVVLVLAVCFACFHWIHDRLVPNQIAPAPRLT